jgi:hypothetical protein
MFFWFFYFWLHDLNGLLLFQALDLSKTRLHNQVMLTLQEMRIMTLEAGSTELRSELEQVHQALVDAESARSSLSMNRDKKK